MIIQVNPGSVILSGEMMLRHLGWGEAADLVIKGMDGAIGGRGSARGAHAVSAGAGVDGAGSRRYLL